MHLRLSVCTLALAPSLLAQQPLLTAIPSPSAKAKAFETRERSDDPAIVRSAFVRIDTRALAAIPASNDPTLASFSLDLFGRKSVLDIRTMETVLTHRLFTGKVRGAAGDVTLAVAPDGTTAGSLLLADRFFVVAWATDGDAHVLREMKEGRRTIPPCKVLPSPVKIPKGKPPAENAGATYFDVMMVYTPAARSRAGSKAAMETQLVNAIGLANTANRNSSVNATFRLVHMHETNYTETGGTNDLSRFRSTSDNIMDEVHALRTTYGADLMQLITEPTRAQYCGVAYLMTSLSTGFRTSSFGVTLRRCLGGHTGTHEMGHNCGCHHDRANAGRGLYPYSYGFRTSDNRYRTVMAYSPGSRVPVWSSPTARWSTYTMGKANSEDNARGLNNARATIAGFTRATMLDFCQLRGGVPGRLGLPTLTGTGTINKVIPIRVTVARYPANTTGYLVIGTREVNVPLFGGTLVPNARWVFPLRGNGSPIVIDGNGLSTAPRGTQAVFQVFFPDSRATQGWAISNGVKVVVP